MDCHFSSMTCVIIDGQHISQPSDMLKLSRRDVWLAIEGENPWVTVACVRMQSPNRLIPLSEASKIPFVEWTGCGLKTKVLSLASTSSAELQIVRLARRRVLPLQTVAYSLRIESDICWPTCQHRHLLA